MNLIRFHNPSNMLNDMFDDYYFRNCNCASNANMVPAVNIKDEKNNYCIDLMAPGMEKEDFHISLENNVLTISSEQTAKKEEAESNYTRKEYESMSFSRSFTLPKNVNMENIKAEYKNGILEVVLPKMEEAKMTTNRQINIS